MDTSVVYWYIVFIVCSPPWSQQLRVLRVWAGGLLGVNTVRWVMWLANICQHSNHAKQIANIWWWWWCGSVSVCGCRYQIRYQMSNGAAWCADSTENSISVKPARGAPHASGVACVRKEQMFAQRICAICYCIYTRAHVLACVRVPLASRARCGWNWMENEKRKLKRRASPALEKPNVQERWTDR